MTKTLNNEELWDVFKIQYVDNNGLSKNRLEKLKVMYAVLERGLDVPIDEATKEDIELLMTKISKGELKSQRGSVFSGSTKSDIKKFLRMFFKWRKGDGVNYPPEVAWLNTRIAKDEKPKEETVMTEADVLKLAKHCNKPEYRALALILFDSGFRIDEAMSVTKADITFEDYGKDKCFWIKCNRSKTFTRKVEIPLFTDEIKSFVNSSYMKSLNDSDAIWNVSYNAIVKALKTAGEQALNRKDIHPHLFRHSSATVYAGIYQGDVISISQRYGWSYSAQEMKTYIRKSGAMQRLASSKSFENNMRKLNERITELEVELENRKKFEAWTFKILKEFVESNPRMKRASEFAKARQFFES